MVGGIGGGLLLLRWEGRGGGGLVGWVGGVENGDGGEWDGAVWGAGWAGERGVEGGS